MAPHYQAGPLEGSFLPRHPRSHYPQTQQAQNHQDPHCLAALVHRSSCILIFFQPFSNGHFSFNGSFSKVPRGAIKKIPGERAIQGACAGVINFDKQ